MKKRIVNVLLSAAVIATMIFTVTACGSKEEELDAAADVYDLEEEDISTEDVDSEESTQEDMEESMTDGDLDTDELIAADVDVDVAVDAVDSEMTEDLDTEADLDGTEFVEANGTDILEMATEDSEEQMPSQPKTPNGTSKNTMTLADWAASEECAQLTAMMNDSLEGMTISFGVDADVLSMIFTATGDADVSEGEMDAFFTDNAVLFEAIRDQLISDTGNRNVVLRLICRNADNSEMFSKDF